MKRLTLTMTQEVALLALLRDADISVRRATLSKLVGKLKGRQRHRDLHHRQTAALVEARLAAEGSRTASQAHGKASQREAPAKPTEPDSPKARGEPLSQGETA